MKKSRVLAVALAGLFAASTAFAASQFIMGTGGTSGTYYPLGGAISQIGDLAFSYVKRTRKVKDFGHVLPGHGGVLDRFDSVIFCAPLIELLIIWLPTFK